MASLSSAQQLPKLCVVIVAVVVASHLGVLSWGPVPPLLVPYAASASFSALAMASSIVPTM